MSLEEEVVSTTIVMGEGTNLIDHNHQISVMRELLTDDSDTTGVLNTSTI